MKTGSFFIANLVLIIAIVGTQTLPLFDKAELEWVKAVQTKMTSTFMDMLMLAAFLPLYYLLIASTFILAFKKDKPLGYALSITTVIYLLFSYVVIKMMHLVVEVPPRYLGARDLLGLYLPPGMLKFWVGTWGFPSEHLVFTTYFTLLMLLHVLRQKQYKMIWIFSLILIYLSTVYSGDHYVTDLFLNALVGAILYLATKLMMIKSFVYRKFVCIFI